MASELVEACRHDNIDWVRILLLDHRTDPNLQATRGQFALMTASYYGHTNVVRLLLDNGADPNLQRYDGDTALMVASRYDRIDTVRELLEHGADPDLQDTDGWTALMDASERYHTSVVELLEAFSGWNQNVAQPLIDLDIFPEGLIREHLTV
jgi:ankyrin repeat protein